MIAEGDYLAKQEQISTSCFAKGSLTYHILRRDDGENPDHLPTANGEINKAHPGQGAEIIGAYLHRTNNDGNALGNPAGGHPVSSACIVIDGRSWKQVEQQLNKSENIFLRLTRK